MRADGEIGKEEYQKLRDQLETEKSRLEAAQKEAEAAECREALNLEQIQQALEELVHLKEKGISRELVDQIVYRVTPVSETQFDWYLHLGPGTDAQAGLLVEGKKGNCVPSVNGIREFLAREEEKIDLDASEILDSLPSEQLPRLQLKTRGNKSYLSFDHNLTFCEASAWCKRADYPFRHSSWKDMTLSVNLDLN